MALKEPQNHSDYGGKKMKKAGIALLLMAMIMTAGCGSNVESVKKTDADAPDRMEEQAGTETEVEEEQEERIYTTGDRIVFDNEYALTIIGVTETDERNEFSEKEVEQVLIVEYLYENLASDEEIYISEFEFKLVDQGGNMMDSYPVEATHSPSYTPKGAKTLGSFAVGTTVKSEKIDMHYYDNFFASESDCIFSIPVGEKVEVSLDGVLPEYPNTFGIGEIIEVSTEAGEYTLTIDSVKKTEERNEYEKRQPEAVYEIQYTYSNISISEPLWITDYSFTLIDEKGNTGYSYPNFSDVSASETVKGARSTGIMFLAAHRDSQKVMLSYKDNMFNTNSDFFIKLENIN